MLVDLSSLQALVGIYLLPLFRISAMLMAMPIIGTRLVPQRVRLSLALALTILIAPLATRAAGIRPFCYLDLVCCGEGDTHRGVHRVHSAASAGGFYYRWADDL